MARRWTVSSTIESQGGSALSTRHRHEAGHGRFSLATDPRSLNRSRPTRGIRHLDRGPRFEGVDARWIPRDVFSPDGKTASRQAILSSNIVAIYGDDSATPRGFREALRQDFDRNFTVERRVGSAPDFAHSPSRGVSQ